MPNTYDHSAPESDEHRQRWVTRGRIKSLAGHGTESECGKTGVSQRCNHPRGWPARAPGITIRVLAGQQGGDPRIGDAEGARFSGIPKRRMNASEEAASRTEPLRKQPK